MHLPKFLAWKLAETEAKESLRLWADAHARGRQSSKCLLEAILKRQRAASHRLFGEAMEEMEAASDSLDRSGAGPGLARPGLAWPGLAWPGLAWVVGACLIRSVALTPWATRPH